jgi:hypothetical protein
MPLEKRPERQPDPVDEPRRPEREDRHRRGPDDFFGLEVERMSPRAQVTASLAVLIPVAVGAVVVFTLIPWLWWLIFVFGWMVFPAFGLLVRGVAGLSEGETGLPASGRMEELGGSPEGAAAPQPDLVSSVPASIGPKGQIVLALAMMVPLATLRAGPELIFRILPELGTSIGRILDIAFLWLVLLSFFLLFNGLRGLLSVRGRRKQPSVVVGSGERELLGALREHGELTPAEAAMETSLTVAEADSLFKELAEGGHLQIRVRGGGLSYSLWGREETGQLEDR